MNITETTPRPVERTFNLSLNFEELLKLRSALYTLSYTNQKLVREDDIEFAKEVYDVTERMFL